MTWKFIFQLKAVINWLESLALLFADRWIRDLLGEKPLTNPEYLQLFVVLVFVIGIGYWWVSQDISRNREIVKLGIYAQYSVFGVLAYQTLIGNVHPFYLCIPLLRINQRWSEYLKRQGSYRLKVRALFTDIAHPTENSYKYSGEYSNF